MTEFNSDKTRIRKSATADSSSGDKTRLASQKTIIKTKSQNDKTRIYKKQLHRPVAGDAATRIDQRVNDDVEKTRVANADELPDFIPLEPVNLSDMGEHGVLKKRFVLESVLGSGGMGIVYKAKDLLKVEAQDRDPYVAIKVLGEEFKSHPEAFISLQRESRKSQRIAHPNIVNVYDFDRDGDIVFMTMEFMDGSPLDQLIRKYKATGLPTDDAWEIIKGMCAALAHAHTEKIIHSDFKPGNVFVTRKGVAKIFDFGIARAVAKVEMLDDGPEDKTLFDAGKLGALTPAYASLEMLEGKEPDVRDDIFALGCVAYELFTGVHPYKKIPANEAARLNIKPKRINNIKKSQWRAIEKAIAFKREDRIESIEKFVEAISPKIKSSNRLATVFALLLSVAITVYFLYFQAKPVEPSFSEFDIRNELELKIRVDYLMQNLEELLKKAVFTTPWQDSIWKNIADLIVLKRGEDTWLRDKKKQIFVLYLSRINSEIDAKKYTYAKKLIQNAKRYNDDHAELDLQIAAIARAVKKQKSRQAAALEQERIRNINLANKRQQLLLDKQKFKEQNKQKEIQKKQDRKTFDIALENVNDQLKCINRLNMRNIETAVNKLRQVDLVRYKKLESKIVNALASCITQTAKSFPERALEGKKHSLRIFKANTLLAGLVIKARDACDKSLAGLGARGKRALCRDKIEEAGTGPELVVIPGSSKLNSFAIGKYEVSINELNNFCKNTAFCETLSTAHAELPVTGIDIFLAKKYLLWLTDNTGKKYRLPTRDEWIYAAKSRRKKLDANRNCQLSTRGFQKGQNLVKVSIGKQNSWGLVNYVGNVQEWVYDKGKQLKAVGGSYARSMDNCEINTTMLHNGSADKITGFRVLREVSNNS